MHRADILVIAGGVIPQKDYPFLIDLGITAIFGPGTPVPFAAKTVAEKLINKWHPAV